MSSQWQNSRNVVERVYIAGSLVLTTPAHFGNGDSDGLTDISLLRDSVNPSIPLLTGASIAGALRNYLREYEAGYGVAEDDNGRLLAEQLFGHLRGDEATIESWLMVDDSRGHAPVNPIEIRDGVALDAATRTAEEHKKFDIELLTAGTRFPLHFELWLTEENQVLKDALFMALSGLESGRIRLGMRKRRGFGQCRVEGWQVQTFKMNEPDDILNWLTYGLPDPTEPANTSGSLPQFNLDRPDKRKSFTIEATFKLKTSLLIRSDSGGADAVDMVHLRSWRNGAAKPVLSGTSLAGVLRQRAYRIANTLKGSDKAREMIDGMFGRRIENNKDIPSGSRVLVSETEIENGIEDRVQNRVKINRFTGGAYPQALFSQQPLFAKQKETTRVKVNVTLRQTPAAEQFKAEVGLLLLLLKDLWLGDLPLGGESGAGRGVLQGESASLSYVGQKWELKRAADGTLQMTPSDAAEELEMYIEALREV